MTGGGALDQWICERERRNRLAALAALARMTSGEIAPNPTSLRDRVLRRLVVMRAWTVHPRSAHRVTVALVRYKIVGVIVVAGCTASLSGMLGGSSNNSAPAPRPTNSSSNNASSDALASNQSSSNSSATNRPASNISSSSSSSQAEASYDPQADALAKMQQSLLKLHHDCALEVAMQFDFTGFDKAMWSDIHDGYGDEDPSARQRVGLRGDAVGECASVISALTQRCKSQKRKPVNTIRCVFDGFSKKQKDDSPEEWTRRNMSLADGVFTMRMGPRLGNVEDNAIAVMMGEKLASELKNGATCSERSNCRTFFCNRGACAACRTDRDCTSLAYCDSGGTCFSRAVLEADDGEENSSAGPSSSGPKKAEGKGLGQSCDSSADCNPRYACKAVNSHRSTCR